jgi:vacuolar-type H+-ATPase subunit I/STV1
MSKKIEDVLDPDSDYYPPTVEDETLSAESMDEADSVEEEEELRKRDHEAEEEEDDESGPSDSDTSDRPKDHNHPLNFDKWADEKIASVRKEIREKAGKKVLPISVAKRDKILELRSVVADIRGTFNDVSATADEMITVTKELPKTVSGLVEIAQSYAHDLNTAAEKACAQAKEIVESYVWGLFAQ